MDARRIDFTQDSSFWTASWKAERVGWFALLGILVLGLLGLLGPGPLSRRTLGEEGAFQVGFDRFGHYETDGTLDLRLDPRAPLSLEDAYLAGLEVRSIRPSPLGVRGDGVHTLFSFPATSSALRVRFEITYRRAGPLSGRIENAGRALLVRHFVYP